MNYSRISAYAWNWIPILVKIKITISNNIFNIKNKCDNNSIQTSSLILYPLRILENQRFSNYFRWYRKRSTAWNRSMCWMKPRLTCAYLSIVFSEQDFARGKLTFKTKSINPFRATCVSIPPENWFSDVSRGYRKKPVAWYGVIKKVKRTKSVWVCLAVCGVGV